MYIIMIMLTSLEIVGKYTGIVDTFSTELRNIVSISKCAAEAAEQVRSACHLGYGDIGISELYATVQSLRELSNSQSTLLNQLDNALEQNLVKKKLGLDTDEIGSIQDVIDEARNHIRIASEKTEYTCMCMGLSSELISHIRTDE